ncbi:MAG: holo-ACP synthase [Acidaminococcaceae bacterium]|nr:holo-ACP synthase [Acidaminococcaceae bacterium]
MMLGIGCDLAEVERIKKAIERNGFKERVFTPEEIAYCTGPHGDKAQSYAARFAAKEAFLKAIGTGLRGGQLTEISVINDELGKPELKVTGYYASYIKKLGVKKIHVTVSHTATTAMAVVVLE